MQLPSGPFPLPMDDRNLSLQPPSGEPAPFPFSLELTQPSTKHLHPPYRLPSHAHFYDSDSSEDDEALSLSSESSKSPKSSSFCGSGSWSARGSSFFSSFFSSSSEHYYPIPYHTWLCLHVSRCFNFRNHFSRPFNSKTRNIPHL